MAVEFNYASQAMHYESNADSFCFDDEPRRKDYSRGKGVKSLRTRGRRRGSHPGCGIGARRNKRVVW